MGLNGIDISSWEVDLVVSAMTACDFVIVKATGGRDYKNECFERHADETLSCGKLLGCYHCQCLGDKYRAVQNRVNEILGASGASSTSMDVDAMARAVIRGDYGNGEERRRRLGSYYSVVQARVNEMLS